MAVTLTFLRLLTATEKLAAGAEAVSVGPQDGPVRVAPTERLSAFIHELQARLREVTVL